MGISNLWSLLLPVGRRISIETLSTKTLAIDASIWLFQFLKAMRDSEGNAVRSAHILGTLRRILKLLYHDVRPVFVFDGQMPSIKRREIKSRKDQREKQEVNVKQAARRLLVARLRERGAEEARVAREGRTRKFVDGEEEGDGDKDGDGEEEVKGGEDGDLERALELSRREVQPSQNVDATASSFLDADDGSDSSVNWEDGEAPQNEPSWETLVPESGRIDMDVVKGLPRDMRKDVIEKAKASMRVASRKQ